MEGTLKIGTVLKSESNIEYKIVKLLGNGGQGEVYEVSSGRKHYALKWYFKKSATANQKRILEKLIERGTPDSTFLWPQDLVVSETEELFGYIMPLRPKEYKGIEDMMMRNAEPSFYSLCKAAFNLTKGYQTLHREGYQYSDISFGNVFLNPDTGDVLICDNDNVLPNGMKGMGVYGTPRFMAPEIVVGKARPSRNTDLHSLAVLLFYMFMLGHPLEGKKEAQIKCMDINAMKLLYGTEPVFVFDPNDKSNRPVKGYQDNVLIYWDIYPSALKELFIQSFTIGLTQPGSRVTENKWLEVIANMISGIVSCPKCGCEVIYDEDKENNGLEHACWGCGSSVKMPSKIFIGKNKILIGLGAKLYSHHINNDYDMEHEVGEVVANPNNPNILGIKNKSGKVWTYIMSDGKNLPVGPEKTAGIARGAQIDFGHITSEFK